jgi:hypothetical protein
LIFSGVLLIKEKDFFFKKSFDHRSGQ